MLAILQRVENDPISESIRARNADAAERLGASFGAFREDDVAFLKSVRARIAEGLDASETERRRRISGVVNGPKRVAAPVWNAAFQQLRFLNDVPTFRSASRRRFGRVLKILRK